MRVIAITTPPPYNKGQVVDVSHDREQIGMFPMKGTIERDQGFTVLVSIEDKDPDGRPLSVFDGRRFWFTEWDGVYEWQGNVWKIP